MRLDRHDLLPREIAQHRNFLERGPFLRLFQRGAQLGAALSEVLCQVFHGRFQVRRVFRHEHGIEGRPAVDENAAIAVAHGSPGRLHPVQADSVVVRERSHVLALGDLQPPELGNQPSQRCRGNQQTPAEPLFERWRDLPRRQRHHGARGVPIGAAQDAAGGFGLAFRAGRHRAGSRLSRLRRGDGCGRAGRTAAGSRSRPELPPTIRSGQSCATALPGRGRARSAKPSRGS